MSSFDEVEAAEARMNAANDELLNYMEKHNTIDRDHHRGLIARLKKARAEFLKAISELGE